MLTWTISYWHLIRDWKDLKKMPDWRRNTSQSLGKKIKNIEAGWLPTIFNWFNIELHFTSIYIKKNPELEREKVQVGLEFGHKSHWKESLRHLKQSTGLCCHIKLLNTHWFSNNIYRKWNLFISLNSNRKITWLSSLQSLFSSDASKPQQNFK